MRISPPEFRRIPATFGLNLISLPSMSFRKWTLGAVLLVLVLAGWCAWLWQPARQVRLHQQNLLRAYERRDWQKVSGFLDSNYADRWAHDKEFVISASRQLFGQFIVLGISTETGSCSAGNGVGRISSRITIQGQGGPLAQIVSDRVNGLHEPFVFDWVCQGWKPWEWKLVRADQPELVLDVPDF
jgi:hypothetical protein